MSIEKASKKILVVDDQEDMRHSLSTLLEVEGYAAMTAKDGLEAEQLHREHRFDMIITDVVMPNASGQQLFQHLRKEKDNTPIIVLTGYPETEDALSFLQGGAATYLRKPTDAGDLISMIEFLLNKTTNEYKDDRKLVVVRRNAATSIESVLDNYATAGVSTDYVYRYLASNPAGVTIIDPEVGKKDAVELIRRTCTTYPFMNIIAYNETLNYETESGRELSTAEVKATAKSIFARLDWKATEQSINLLGEKVADAFNDRERRIRSAISKKRDSCTWLLTGPRASGKSAAATAVSIALTGLVSNIPIEISRHDDTVQDNGNQPVSYEEYDRRADTCIAQYTHGRYDIRISRHSLERELRMGRDVIIEVPNPEKLAYVKERISAKFAGTKVVTLCLLAQPELLYQRSQNGGTPLSSAEEARMELKRFTTLSRNFNNAIWTDSIPANSNATTEQDEYRGLENTTRLLCAIIRQGRF